MAWNMEKKKARYLSAQKVSISSKYIYQLHLKKKV